MPDRRDVDGGHREWWVVRGFGWLPLIGRGQPLRVGWLGEFALTLGQGGGIHDWPIFGISRVGMDRWRMAAIWMNGIQGDIDGGINSCGLIVVRDEGCGIRDVQSWD